MNFLLLILIIILIYIFLVFVIPLLFFPGFLRDIRIKKSKLLENFSEKFKDRNKEKTMRNIFDYVSKRYEKSEKLEIFFLLKKHFDYDVENILSKKGYLPCHIQNLLVKTLLVNTEQFKEEEFETKISITLWGTIHAHMIIKIGNKKFKVDPYYGILNET